MSERRVSTEMLDRMIAAMESGHTALFDFEGTMRDLRDERAHAERLAEAIREYVEWGAMTGSDRDLLMDGFKKALAEHERRNG